VCRRIEVRGLFGDPLSKILTLLLSHVVVEDWLNVPSESLCQSANL
jgi:hypothetical protein